MARNDMASSQSRSPPRATNLPEEVATRSQRSQQRQEVHMKRTATVYDAVAGRMGLAGFLADEQTSNPNHLPSAPEEVLLRRINAPDEIPYGFYDEDDNLAPGQRLPDSDLLKAVHTYVSDFYHATSEDGGTADFRSFDETALLALGILLEEATKEALGENGDMAMVEPKSLDHAPLELKMTKHQIIGRVVPRKLTSNDTANLPTVDSSDELEDEASPRKKRR